MNRKREQADLFYAMGQLLGPLQKMVANPNSYDQDERVRIVARFLAERDTFRSLVSAYCNGEPGHNYRIAQDQIMVPLHRLEGLCSESNCNPAAVEVERNIKASIDGLFSIPVPIDSVIHEAKTPFSTYRLVKDICSTARNDIVWLDRYFDQSIFGRYFVDSPNTTVITLINWPQSKCTSTRDNQRYADFMSVSKLFALERGPTAYRLLTVDAFHDRLLKCDGQMFTFGGSIKEIGNDSTFTIGRIDSTPENEKKFSDVVVSGTEIFGPTQTIHP